MVEFSPPEILVHPDSMGDTLNAINTVLFYDLPISQEKRQEVACWVAGRQGLPHSYAGMFAPTAYDLSFGALTFTGEPVVSSAGAAHMLSEEACRILFLLDAPDLPEVALALKSARRALLRRLRESQPEGIWAGVYCCPTCSVALWRHLGASGDDDDARRLENGMYDLKRRRDGKGRWRQYPFYYTLLALSELNLPAAWQELEYALPAVERALRRIEKTDPTAETELERRRRITMGRILEKL